MKENVRYNKKNDLIRLLKKSYKDEQNPETIADMIIKANNNGRALYVGADPKSKEQILGAYDSQDALEKAQDKEYNK